MKWRYQLPLVLSVQHSKVSLLLSGEAETGPIHLYGDNTIAVVIIEVKAVIEADDFKRLVAVGKGDLCYYLKGINRCIDREFCFSRIISSKSYTLVISGAQ